ncbi:MAG TPA: ChbG/HpnK family deacetylase [Pseudomonadota bacterium]|nr:ChbG/HpnK family deacetylase [Pseudomonadota bacterium]
MPASLDAARRQVVITADDFGWTDSQNRAVERGAAAGTLHRASLLCNGQAFAEAVDIARRYPRLGVGVHLTLCEGPPLSAAARQSELCIGAKGGCFPDGLGPLVQLYLRGRLPLSTIETEWRAQIERAQAAGLRLSHLDGHKHVHLLPPLFDLTLRLAGEYGVGYVRVPQEAASLRVLRRAGAWAVLRSLSQRARHQVRRAGLQAADHFVGFSESGGMSAERLAILIRGARPGVTEIMLHPAEDTAGVSMLRQRFAWARRYRFEQEAAALCHPAVREALGSLE